FGQLFDWAVEAGAVDAIAGLHGVPLGDHRDLAPDALEFECAVALAGDADPPAPPRGLTLPGGGYPAARPGGRCERRRGPRDLAPDALEFECAIALAGDADPPAPLRCMTLPGGDYAAARHVGRYDRLEGHVDRVLRDWWPGSGRALRDAPIRYEFLDDPETV